MAPRHLSALSPISGKPRAKLCSSRLSLVSDGKPSGSALEPWAAFPPCKPHFLPSSSKISRGKPLAEGELWVFHARLENLACFCWCLRPSFGSAPSVIEPPLPRQEKSRDTSESRGMAARSGTWCHWGLARVDGTGAVALWPNYQLAAPSVGVLVGKPNGCYIALCTGSRCRTRHLGTLWGQGEGTRSWWDTPSCMETSKGKSQS